VYSSVLDVFACLVITAIISADANTNIKIRKIPPTIEEMPLVFFFIFTDIYIGGNKFKIIFKMIISQKIFLNYF